MEENYFSKLVDRFLNGVADEKERQLLEEYYKRLGTTGHTDLNAEQERKLKVAMWNTIQQQIDVPPVSIVHISWFKRFRFLAAAAILIMIGTGVYFYASNKTDHEERMVKTNTAIKHQNDVQPGGNKAILTLADGSSVVLDDLKQDASVADQGSTKVIKINGKLSYEPNSEARTNEIVYNTITTPRGGQYQVELPDGSEVWLNAASSLRFPTNFTGKQRSVEITGEAYFEVTKNAEMPFIVKVNGAEVQVLGTHFNVNGYWDESTIKTTLLEGSVRFVNGSASSMLKPGQQSQLAKDGSIKVVNNIDVNKEIAWKNGFFQFENADIATISRQLSRWYDVDVVYDDKINDVFYAKIPRNSKLSEVMKMIELAGSIHSQIEGKKVIIKP